MNNCASLDHIAIATNDLAKSLAFFQKLGFIHKDTADFSTRGIRIAVIYLQNTKIELIEPLRANSEISSFLQKRGPGIHHLAFQTNDIHKSTEQLKKDGVSFTTDKPTLGIHDSSVCFIHPKSSNGVLLELVEHSTC